MSMKTGLLTDKEREILEYYLKTGFKMDGLSALIFEFKSTRKKIEQDLKLVAKVLAKDGKVAKKRGKHRIIRRE